MSSRKPQGIKPQFPTSRAGTPFSPLAIGNRPSSGERGGQGRTRGIGGHQSSAAGSEVWLTPPAILQALGSFDLDPCAAPAPQPWPTAAKMLTKVENGLLAAWHGRVWLNPPYGAAVGRWMRRMADHGRGTALVFPRTETEWFFDSVWRAETADAALFLNGRLNFHLPDGSKSRYNAGGPSVLIAYGVTDAEQLHASGIEGRFIPLSRAVAVFVAAPDLTWRSIVADALRAAGGEARLSDIYAAIANHPKAQHRRHWRAKVRQQLQGNLFERTGPGQYALMTI